MKYLLLLVLVLLLAAFPMLRTLLRPAAEEPAPELFAERPTVSGQLPPPNRPAPVAAPGSPAAPLAAVATAPADASRDRIAAAKTPADLAVLHSVLSAQLLDQLETLGTSNDPAAVRVAVQELADRFYLVDRVAKVRRWPSPGPGSINPAQRERVESLLRVWQENMALALTVDQLFRDRGLLTDEHVPQALRRWSEEGPGDAP